MMKTVPANWPAPAHIKALCTTRCGGFSLGAYAESNLALHVDDDPILVEKNRLTLMQELNLPGAPIWLEQTHTTRCIIAEEDQDRHADAAITRSAHHPLVILTADCLPIVLTNRAGTEIAAIHAGWRGLEQGIIANTLAKMTSKPQELIAWVGPAISQKHYEVGFEVFSAFTTHYPQTNQAFKPHGAKWFANLPLIAELIMLEYGLSGVFQSGLCTFTLNHDFYSYRKAAQTGRIATLIWFDPI